MVAETVAADDHAGMQDHVSSQTAAFADGDMRVDQTVRGDPYVRFDHDLGADPDARCKLHTRSDDRVGADRSHVSQLGVFVHEGGVMDAGREGVRQRGGEELQDAAEGGAGVGGA